MDSGLNPAQRAAVEHGEGPLCVLAGAGSGKTRVLVHRIARLVDRGVSPQEILAVTFSNKAAGEMRGRLFGLLGNAARGMWIGTFHGTCARLLRMSPDRVGLGRDFSIFDDDDQIRLITTLIKQDQLSDSITPRTVASLIDRAKNRGANPAEMWSGPTGVSPDAGATRLAPVDRGGDRSGSGRACSGRLDADLESGAPALALDADAPIRRRTSSPG
jgi:DNA helicase-2/ATP-dependent DNA helicase PcrA